MSPDLNPIENLWPELKFTFRGKYTASIQEIKQTPKEEYEKIPTEKCKKLIDGYKIHLEVVVAVKWGSTKYKGGVPLLLPILGFFFF